MCQNNMDDANDYSLLTANTGMVTIDTANSSLAGTGTTVVLTAGGINGTIVKSVIIKAIEPVTQGMVRLFIDNGTSVVLYKEVPVDIQPQAAAVPLPVPKYTMFELVLNSTLKLPSGCKLRASTQNAESFNIITEALDWTYPETLPYSCCNFEQETADTGVGVVSVANAALNGSGTIVPLFTADAAANGATISSITIKALQSTNPGTVRLFISDDSGTPKWYLMQEISIPQSTQSAFEPSFKQVLNMNYNLQPGYLIGASTDISQSFAITVEGINWKYPI